jgi:protease IV
MTALKAFFRMLWRFLDGLRRVLHLLLLLIIFGFVFGALRDSIPVLPTKAALVIAPEGELVEQLAGDPLQRALEQAQGQGRSQTLLWDVTDAIQAAAKDERVAVIVLDLEQFAGAGLPKLQELAQALRSFRATGKKVLVYGTQFLQANYYLAAQADEIYLDPMGFVLLDGYERYRTYFKDTLEKLAIDVNVFRVGTYKSAVEVFTRNEMSPEEREESLQYLNSVWGVYQADTVKARRLPADAIARYVTQFSEAVAAARGDTAQVALKNRLVTGVLSRSAFERRVTALVGENEAGDSFSAIDDVDYIRVLQAEDALSSEKRARVGVIVAAGDILDGDQPAGTVGGVSTARLIRDARLDDDVAALVLRVDSPGGSVLASEEIHRELQDFKATGKPLIVSMGDLAASGGYYIAALADEIWASPATLTGSIGIFAIIPTIDRSLEKLGMKVDGVGTTPLSGQLRLDRPLGAQAQSLLQSAVQHGYQEFLARVAAGRRKTLDQVDAVAQGRVWAGIDAKRLGLVDQLGTFNAAVAAAAKRAKLQQYDVKFIEPPLSVAEQLALEFQARIAAVALRAAPEHLRAATLLKQADSALPDELVRFRQFVTPHRLYAHCFCTLH